MRQMLLLAGTFYLGVSVTAAQSADRFASGEAISLERAIPANERGILCLAVGGNGRIYGGTTGRAAHLFVFDPTTNEVRSLARLEGGIGFAYGLIRLPDGSLIGGTQADPTGIAVRTDPQAVGHLYRFRPAEKGTAKVEDLGVAVAGQGIYTLAYIPKTNEIIGNTWPDGHLFTCDLQKRKFTDHGVTAGYRTFETPAHAADINRGSGQKVHYSRQVSRAVAVHPEWGAFTGGADGFLYRYDYARRKVEKSPLRLPAAAGRESWASLDAAMFAPEGESIRLFGGTSDGYLFELRFREPGKHSLRSWGKALSQGGIQGMVCEGGEALQLFGIGGNAEGMPRSFRFDPEHGLIPGGIPHVDGRPSMLGFGRVIVDDNGVIWAGERDRIGRLVRYSGQLPARSAVSPQRKQGKEKPCSRCELTESAPLPCHIVFAPQGTTTDGSGYTAIEMGKDGRIYVGAARYGDYAWLLRFDPAAKPVFMEKAVSLRQLTGEHKIGINTQGKIHAKILVAADGRVWFATKQAHEIFDTRPEYGEDADGFPGGHLCYFDPKTGFSRSMGILKKQEGIVAGAIDNVRGKLYYRSEPKNVFLVYDITTGQVRERGHVGASCRYMAMDGKGRVYTVGRGAMICRYDPQTDYVEDLAVHVAGEGGYEPPYVITIGPDGKLYGLGTSHPWIMEFDIAHVREGSFPQVTMRNVAPAAPPGYPVQDIHAAIFGKDGKLYYPLNTTGPLTKDGKAEPHLRIMRYDPASEKSETVGVPQLMGFDEEKVKHVYTRSAKFRLFYMQGAAVGPDGSLYLMGIYPQLHVAYFPKLTALRSAPPPADQELQDLQGASESIKIRIRSIEINSPGKNGAILSPEVVAEKDGGIRLAHSVLLAYETGTTDYRQTETLSERVQAKKIFHLDSADVTSAELFFFGEAKKIAVNGHALENSKPLISTGWTRAKIPPNCLKAGSNEVILFGGGSLLIESNRGGHSYKSRDSGRTWSADELGKNNNLRGEYLVRLRLGRYAPRGWAMSPVLDRFSGDESDVPTPWKIDGFGAYEGSNANQPKGTHLTAWLRTGSTPVPDEAHWIDWHKLVRPWEQVGKSAGNRWAQLKYELVTTRPQATPRLRAFHFMYDGPSPDDSKRRGGSLKILNAEASDEARNAAGSVPFVYQPPSPRLQRLREKYHLDQVIAPGKTEMEQLMLLRYWVRNQCHRGWASHPALWIPPWDALLILESRDRPDCLVMCTHYACVFTQCCLALGWNARHCILDHHCVSEVWVDSHRKWVMIDTGNSAERADVGLHFERNGVPLSARELHLIHRNGDTKGVQVRFTPKHLMQAIASLCRPAPTPKGKTIARPDVISLAELRKYPVCQLENYRRYAFPPRNNFLETLVPGELEHGFSHYFYDGYYWVGDSPDDPHLSPEYSRHLSPDRPQDIDWPLNGVRIYLSRTKKADELQVDLAAQVPNLARLEKQTSAAWQATEARFVWKLQPGTNVLRVRGVNHWGRKGSPSAVRVEWKPKR